MTSEDESALRQRLDELARLPDDALETAYAMQQPRRPPGVYWQLRWLAGRILRWLQSLNVLPSDPLASEAQARRSAQARKATARLGRWHRSGNDTESLPGVVGSAGHAARICTGTGDPTWQTSHSIPGWHGWLNTCRRSRVTVSLTPIARRAWSLACTAVHRSYPSTWDCCRQQSEPSGGSPWQVRGR